MFKLWYIKNDPCGMFSAIFTIFLLLFAEFVITTIIILPWLGFGLHFILFTFVIILALAAHTRAQFSDPGCVPEHCFPPVLPSDVHFEQIHARPYNAPKICRVCRTLKPKNTYHCATCNRCIVNMDHHCPWVNNCIGVFNQKYFFLFLIYTALACLYTGTLLVLRFLACNNSPYQCDIQRGGTILSLLCFIEALLFGVFTLVMLYDQVNGVLEGSQRDEQDYQFDMEKYKDIVINSEAQYFSLPPVQPVQKSVYQLFQEVFGGPFGLHWLSPFAFPEHIRLHYLNQVTSCISQADSVTEKFVNYARLKSQELAQKQASTVNEQNKQLQRQQQKQQQQQQHSEEKQGIHNATNKIDLADFDNNNESLSDDKQESDDDQQVSTVQKRRN